MSDVRTGNPPGTMLVHAELDDASGA